MPRRKKKKKLFYFGLKNNGKHFKEEEINAKKQQEAEAINMAKKEKKEIENQNKIEEKQKKKQNKERIKRIQNKNKEIKKIKIRETKEELKNNKFTNKKQSDEIFNLENEIVLGINNNTIKKAKPTKKKANKKKMKVPFFIKCTSFLTIMIILTIIALTSDLFNITEIVIQGNNIISSYEITELADIEIGQNIFKINKKNIISNIKNNAYIKSVQINKELPTKLKITVEERISTYMIECAGNYLYMDNQGYLLELSNQALNVPIITGIEETEEELLTIKRLNLKDLLKLNDVLKISETLKNYNIYEYVSKIDITKNKNYAIYMQKIGKVAYIGDMTDLNNKIEHLKGILAETQEKNGIIYINGNFNEGFKPYFSENVQE